MSHATYIISLFGITLYTAMGLDRMLELKPEIRRRRILTKEEEYGNWVLDDKSTWTCKCSMLDECQGPPDGICNGPYGEEKRQ